MATAVSIEDGLNILLDRTEKMEAQLSVLAALQASVQRHDVEIEALHDKCKNIDQLSLRVAELEQRSRINNIEIVGVPTTKEEDASGIVTMLATKVGYALNVSDIIKCHRVNSFKNKYPNIVCQMATRKVRDELLNAAKVFNREQKSTLRANILHKSFPSTNIYFNEHLTQLNKKLLSAAKAKKVELKWSFVWVKDGAIFARKSPESKIVRLSSFEDINEMK